VATGKKCLSGQISEEDAPLVFKTVRGGAEITIEKLEE